LLYDLNYLAKAYAKDVKDADYVSGSDFKCIEAPMFADVGEGRLTVQSWLDYDTTCKHHPGPFYLIAESGQCAPLRHDLTSETPALWVKLEISGSKTT